METNQKITYGIVGILALLAGFGGNMLLTQEQMNLAYVCSTTSQVGVFTSIQTNSTTSIGIYKNGTKNVQVPCSGEWTKLSSIFKQTGLSYSCDQIKCVPINSS